jgi:class 3 adenylate cyclase
MKYDGLIEETPYRMFRHRMATLLNYVDTVAPTFWALNSVVSVLRLLQFVGTSLCAAYPAFWSDKESCRGIVGMLSITWHILPPGPFLDYGHYFNFVAGGLMAISIVTFVASAITVQKTANLPQLMPGILTGWMNSFGFLLHPIIVEISFEFFGHLAVGAVENDAVEAAAAAFGLVFSFIWIAMYCLVLAPTLLFRPTSLITTCTEPADLLFVGQSVISAVIGFGTYMPEIEQVVCLIVAALIYFAMIALTFCYGGFAQDAHSVGFQACCVTGGVFCLVHVLLVILEKQATLVILIVTVLGFAVLALAAHFLNARIIRGRLLLLDSIMDDRERTENFTSVNHWTNVTIDGFRIGHPVCLDWSILKWAIERWPDSALTWFLYAKFVCIFPEQSQTLSWIHRTVISNHVKGSATRTVKAQSLSIARQREPNLAPELKVRLKQFTKVLTSTKHKLRRVWDLAIQSNIMDMDEATKRALEAIDQCDASMRHITRQFPNNRFVTRQYARFADELLADHALAAEMIEKSRLLQRDIQVNKDKAHEWGIHAFPNLPDRTSTDRQPGANDNLSMGDISEVDPEMMNQGQDDSPIIAHQIRELTIPGIRNSIILQLALFIVFQLVEVPVLMALATVLEENMLVPLDFFHSQSMLRTGGYLIASLSQLVVYCGQNVNGIVIDKPPNTTVEGPLSVGGSWDIRDQLHFWCRETGVFLQEAMLFRTFRSPNNNIHKAQQLLFDPITEFTFFDTGVAAPERKPVSIHVGFINILSMQTSLLDKSAQGPLGPSAISGASYLNTNWNIPILCPLVKDCINYLIVFLQEYNDSLKFIWMVVCYASLASGAVLILFCLGMEIHWIRSNKEKVYMCLTALPKNNVSAIAENLRVRKRDEESSSQTNAETSKQDDNIMKIFVAGGSSALNAMLDQIEMISCVALTAILFVVGMVILQGFFAGQADTITSASPHLTYLQGAWAVCISTTTDMMQMYWLGGVLENPIPELTKESLVKRFNANMEIFNEFYTDVRFGNKSLEVPAYMGYPEGSRQARQHIQCANEEAIPHSFDEATACYPPDMVYGMMEAFLKARVYVFERNTSKTNLTWNIRVLQFWALLISPIYEYLVQPMFAQIQTTIRSDLKARNGSTLPIIIVLLIFSVLFEIGSILQIRNMEVHMRRTLQLLLHCPVNVILQCSKVMTVLGGDFSTRRRDEGAKTAAFFREVVIQIPDAIVTALTDTHEVVSVNMAAERAFGEGLVGRNVREWLAGHFQGDVEALLWSSPTDAKGKCESLTFQKDAETLMNLETTLLPMGDTVVFVFRDVTQVVRYNTLIQFERSKSDQMLRSILPPSLVPRVQAGEKNISFAVSSASILFLDIVSFTPWCGSNPADKVMMTLNTFFKKLDVWCNSYSTMTRIKYIGDCYVAAGGVFSEVNQPAEHTKQVVSFGVDALDSVTELNKELGESLEIRVGVNTGGPIVAGVLGGGFGKPTFEILGPSINMAQQMEHHGIPMNVHISRAVYELIYGDQFVVKERGPIEVKQGVVVTYLVTGRMAPR